MTCLREYDTEEQTRARLAHTYVVYKPDMCMAYVYDILGPNVVQIRVDDPMGETALTVPLSDLEYFEYNLGWVYAGNGLCYLTRDHKRQWKQGLCANNTSLYAARTGYYVGSVVDVPKDHLTDMHKGLLVKPFAEAMELSKQYGGRLIPVSNTLAVGFGGCFYHYAMGKIGDFFDVSEKYPYLMDSIMEVIDGQRQTTLNL